MGKLVAALADMQHGLAVLDRTLGQQNPRYLLAKIAYSSVLGRTDAHAGAVRMKTTAERQLKEFYRQQCGECTISAVVLH